MPISIGSGRKKPLPTRSPLASGMALRRYVPWSAVPPVHVRVSPMAVAITRLLLWLSLATAGVLNVWLAARQL